MINELEEQYVQIISDIYPGLATLWGDENGRFTDITKQGIEKAIKALKSIKKQCDSISDIDYLISNINLRLFELTVLRSRVLTAFYFFSFTLDTLLILWDDFVIYKYGLKESVLQERLINIIPKIDIAIKEMRQRDFSYIDIICTEAAIKSAVNELKEKQKEYKHMANLFIEVEKKCAVFLGFVISLKESIDDINIMYSYGPDIILQYINIKSSWDINAFEINRIYNEAIENFNEPFLKISTGDKKCTIEIIEGLIHEIYEETKAFFGEMPGLQNNLKIIEFDDRKSINGTFYYVTALEDGRPTGYLFFSSNYRFESIEQLKLKLVHEVYPGHHFMMNLSLDYHGSKNKYRLWRNDFLFEGWAKYCEFYYASMNCTIKFFENNLSFMSLMFIIIMDIHYYSLPLKTVIKHAKELCKLESEYVKVLVLNAFRDWERHFNYYLGFNYLMQKKDININQLIKNANL